MGPYALTDFFCASAIGAETLPAFRCFPVQRNAQGGAPAVKSVRRLVEKECLDAMLLYPEQLAEYARIFDDLKRAAEAEGKHFTDDRLARRMLIVAASGLQYGPTFKKQVLSNDSG